MILFGINVGISQNLMVRIDLIDNLFKGKGRTILDFFRDILGLGVSSVFMYSTLNMIKIGKFQKSPAMQIPMHYVYTVLFIGFLLAVLSILLGMVEKYLGKKGGAA
jgi:TRAP-type C4-dicarboxylate transport system permease small subunit